MKDFLCKIKMSIIEKTIYEILKRIFMFVFSSGTTFVLVNIYTSHLQFISQYAVILSISFGTGIGLLSILLLKRKTEFDYIILFKEYEYKYINLKSIVFTKKFKIRAMTNKCDRLFDKYNWTGSGPVDVKCSDQDFNIIMLHRSDNFQRLEVCFGRNLKIGETIEIELTYTLDDAEIRAIPYLCTTIVEPTKFQILRVVVPDEFKLQRANTEIRRSVESHLSESSDIKPFKNNVCEWEIAKPKLYYVYSIKWNFDHLL